MDTGEPSELKSLTTIELRDIFLNCKTSNFAKEPDFTQVLKIVSNLLDVLPCEKLLADIKDEFKKYIDVMKRNQKVTSTKRAYENNVCLIRTNYSPKHKTPLNSVGIRQQRRRMAEFNSLSKAKAEEQGVSPSKLHAHALKSKFPKRKKVAELAKQWFDGDISKMDELHHVDYSVASAVFDTGKMTRRIYTNIRLILKAAGKDILPPFESLLKFRKNRRPSVKELEEPYIGVKFDYAESLKLATHQLLKSIKNSAINNLSELHISVHDGLDGSGGHSIFNQKGSTETNNIIMYMFRIENIREASGEIVWTNPAHASSSSCRPVMLLMGKETYENCQIVSKLQAERSEVKFTLNDFNNPINVTVTKKNDNG